MEFDSTKPHCSLALISWKPNIENLKNQISRRKNETIKAMVESEEDNFEKSTTEIETLSHKIKQIENLNETLRTPGQGSSHSRAWKLQISPLVRKSLFFSLYSFSNPCKEKRKQTKTSCVQTSPLWKAKIRSYASSENLRKMIHKPNIIPKVENRIKEVPVRYNVGIQVNISKPRGIRLRNFIRKDSLKRDSVKRRSSKKYSKPSDAEIRQVLPFSEYYRIIYVFQPTQCPLSPSLYHCGRPGTNDLKEAIQRRSRFKSSSPKSPKPIVKIPKNLKTSSRPLKPSSSRKDSISSRTDDSLIRSSQQTDRTIVPTVKQNYSRKDSFNIFL